MDAFDSSQTLTATERELAAIWSELLEQPVIRRGDSFFDLGGHSLLAVQLVLRVREVFGVDLPIDDVYSAGMTLESLAANIDAYRLGETNPGAYAAMLAEIENLPDDEAEALLAQEDPGWGKE